MFDIKNGYHKVKCYIENDFVLAAASFRNSQYCQKKKMLFVLFEFPDMVYDKEVYILVDCRSFWKYIGNYNILSTLCLGKWTATSSLAGSSHAHHPKGNQ